MHDSHTILEERVGSLQGSSWGELWVGRPPHSVRLKPGKPRLSQLTPRQMFAPDVLSAPDARCARKVYEARETPGQNHTCMHGTVHNMKRGLMPSPEGRPVERRALCTLASTSIAAGKFSGRVSTTCAQP